MKSNETHLKWAHNTNMALSQINVNNEEIVKITNNVNVNKSQIPNSYAVKTELDLILEVRTQTPPSSDAFWAFTNVMNGKKGYIRISYASTALLYNAGTSQSVNFSDARWHYYDFSSLNNTNFYTIAQDTSKDVKLEFFEEDSIFKIIFDNRDKLAIKRLSYNYTRTDGDGTWAFNNDEFKQMWEKPIWVRVSTEDKLAVITAFDVQGIAGEVTTNNEWRYNNIGSASSGNGVYLAVSKPSVVYCDFIEADGIDSLLLNQIYSNYAVLESFGGYLVPGHVGQNRNLVLSSNNYSNFILNGFPVKQGQKFQYIGLAHWHAIYLINADGQIVDIKDSGIDATTDPFEFTISEDGYLYAWSTEGANFIRFKDTDLHKDFNYSIVDLIANKLEVAKKLDLIFNEIACVKKNYYGFDYSFNRGTSGFFRKTWYFDLDEVKKQIDQIGEFKFFIEILSSTGSNSSINGTIYAIGDAQKYSVNFTEVEGVYTTGLVKISCNLDDYNKAIEYGTDNFEVFWQGGSSNPFEDCTYTIKQLYSFIYLNDVYIDLNNRKSDKGVLISETPTSSDAYWGFVHALDGKKVYIRVKNASTCRFYYNYSLNPTNINIYDGRWHLIDASDKTDTEFYTIAENPNDDVVAEIFDVRHFPETFLEDYAALSIVKESLKFNFIANLPYSFNRGTSGYPRKYWYFDLDEVKFEIDHYGFFDIFIEITTLPYRSDANGSFFLDGGDVLKYTVTFTEVEGVYTTGLVNIRVNINDYNTIVAHGKTQLILFWQYGTSPSYQNCEYTIKQAYYLVNKLFYSEKQLNKIGGTEKTFEIAFRGYSAMTPIDVKKDGSGDFTSIQEAINSITDASVLKQYVINVYDDFDINDLTELWSVDTPTIRNASAAPSSSIALVVLKNWIHLRGIGSPKRLYVESPNIDMASSCFQYIQTIYPKGNCSIDNFYVGIKGGRYAIHQEAGGGTSQPDYHATTYYRNLVVEHKGNYMYTNGQSGWSSTMAQANGTAPGLKVIYENVKWISDCYIPFYTHTNLQDNSGSYDEPNEVTFINCSMTTNSNISLSDFNPYWGDIGSGKITIIKMIGCNIPKFTAGLGSSRGFEQLAFIKDVESTGSRMVGYGNTLTTIFTNTYNNCLTFKTIDNNKDIEIIGGTAIDAIWGETIKKFSGTSDAYGIVTGKRFISDPQTWASQTPSQVYTLAHLLGNCANTPKTLVVRVDGTNYTISFNKNYVTADGSSYSYNTTPAYSNTQIINEINAQYPSVFICGRGLYSEIYSFDDCQETAVNRSGETIFVGDAVCRDYANGFNAWRLCEKDEKADGIAGCRMNPTPSGRHDETGFVILSDMAIFTNIGITGSVGQMFALSTGRHTNWYQTNDKSVATFVVISPGFVKSL